MALYHLHCDIIGRSGGKSAVGSVGYQFRMNVTDKTTNEKMYYSKKSDKPLKIGFENPLNAPSFAQCKNKKDVANFWNEVQKKENRKNSQFARDFDIALQKELTLQQNVECLQRWIYQNYTSRGLCASWAIHGAHKNNDGSTNDNIHAHVMVALRKVDEKGWTEKDRDGNDREFLKKVRESWATIVNDKFIEWRMQERISAKSNEERGIEEIPQQHKGAARTAMERKGAKLEIENIQISVTENEIIHKLEKDKEYQNIEEKLIFYNNFDMLKNKVAPLEERLCGTTNLEKTALKNNEILTAYNWYDYIKANSKDEYNYYQDEFLQRSKNNDFRGSILAEKQRNRVYSISHTQAIIPDDENYKKILELRQTAIEHFPSRFEKCKNWLLDAVHPLAVLARQREKLYRKFVEKHFPKLSHKLFGTELKQENNTPQIRPPKDNGYSR